MGCVVGLGGWHEPIAAIEKRYSSFFTETLSYVPSEQEFGDLKTVATAMEGRLVLQAEGPAAVEPGIVISPDVASRIGWTMVSQGGSSLGFSLAIGGAKEGTYHLVFDDHSPSSAQLSIVHETPGELRTVHRETFAYPVPEHGALVPVAVGYAPPSLTWEVGSLRGECELEFPLDRVTYSLVPHSVGGELLVDDVEVAQVARSAEYYVVVSGDFDFAPFHFPLMSKMGLSTAGKAGYTTSIFWTARSTLHRSQNS